MSKDINFNIRKKDIEVLEKCPLCKSKNFKLISKIFNKNINFLSNSFCQNCSLIYKSSRPSLKWFLQNFKKRDKFQKQNNINPINLNTEKIRKLRYLKISKFFQSLNLKGNLLDVGTGTGLGLLEFRKKNFYPEGIEPDISRSRVGKKKNLKISELNIERFSSKKKYDVVTFVHSLEHLHNFKSALKKAIDMLKFDGYIYIEVPNLHFNNFGVDENLYLGHMYNFSEASLLNLKYFFEIEPIYRFYPDLEENNYSIAIMFKKTQKQIKKLKLRKLKLSLIKKKFFPNKLKNKKHITFDVELINDLSMTLKSSNNVFSNVYENYKQKKIFISKNQILKTKKISQIIKTEKKINIKRLKKIALKCNYKAYSK